MGYLHFFDYYTVRVRQHKHKSNDLIRSFGQDEMDLLNIVSNFLESIDQFSSNEQTKTMVGRDDLHFDETNHLIYGTIRSGNFGMTRDVLDKNNGDIVYTIGEDQGDIFKFFYMFFLPPNSTTGALIVHKIGNHGIFTRLKQDLLTFFRFAAPGNLLEIDPVHYNLQRQDAAVLKQLELSIFEKKSATGMSTSGSVDGRRKKRSTFILEVPGGHRLLQQILRSNEPEKIVIESMASFLQIQNLENYDTLVNAKVELNGQAKTIRIHKHFQYNTSEDVTESLNLEEGGVPTLESLKECALSSIVLLRSKYVL